MSSPLRQCCFRREGGAAPGSGGRGGCEAVGPARGPAAGMCGSLCRVAPDTSEAAAGAGPRSPGTRFQPPWWLLAMVTRAAGPVSRFTSPNVSGLRAFRWGTRSPFTCVRRDTQLHAEPPCLKINK